MHPVEWNTFEEFSPLYVRSHDSHNKRDFETTNLLPAIIMMKIARSSNHCNLERIVLSYYPENVLTQSNSTFFATQIEFDQRSFF